MFGQENQSSNLNKIPVEYFGEFLEYATENEIDTEIISLLGGSKGAEYCLLLSNYYEKIDNLILYSPSCYIYQGLDFSGSSSSSTYASDELPFISLFDCSLPALLKMQSAMLLNYPITYHDMYVTAQERTEIAKRL